MRTPFTINDILTGPAAARNQHLVEDKPVKKSKYNNVKVEFDGKVFDSKGECTRYILLRMLETTGEIKDLNYHFPVYELNPGGAYSLKYEPDFTYTDIKTGIFIVEDFKGFLTAEFKKKQKLLKEVYGIEINIVK